MKKAVILYFLLLIFEGSLRKWVLPQLSTPLLIVRDPVAIWLLYKSFQTGLFKPNGYVLGIWVISFAAFIIALLVGHGNLSVAIFGLRITLFHFPLIFIIGKILNLEDALQIGIWLLWISIAMTVLVAIQFYSPQTAWVNRGIGGDLEGSGFGGAAGYYRVPGTFSFTNGLSFFYGLVAAYIFYFWLSFDRRQVSRWLLALATVSLLAAIPLSISRTLLFEVALSLFFVLILAGRQPKIAGQLLGAVVMGGVILLTLANFSFFQTAVYAFTERFTSANKSEGGLEGVFLDRFLGGMIGAITNTTVPFWGLGLGMGTNAGAKLLTGKMMFLVAEAEWGRLIGEMGLLLGIAMITIRLSVVVHLFRRSWRAVGKHNFLPWLLLSFAALNVLQGQWAQPTALGFAVLSGGLVLAALKNPVSNLNTSKATEKKRISKKRVTPFKV